MAKIKAKIKYEGWQLDAALLNVTDILQRCLLPILVLGDTARDIKAGPERLTESDGVYLGIKKSALVPEVISNLNTFAANRDLHYGMENFKVEDDQISWTHNGVPIYIKIIHNKYKFFEHPDQRFYRLEEYFLPNPFNDYWAARGIVK